MALNANEQAFLNHLIRWGSDGYPVMKRGRQWFWDEFYGIKGAAGAYRTKKEAWAAVAAYEQILIEKKAGRI
jgi:hypothetical protein